MSGAGRRRGFTAALKVILYIAVFVTLVFLALSFLYFSGRGH